LLAIGIIGGGLAFLLFFAGLRITTSSRAAFLQKTLPLFVLPMAFVFLKEKIGKKHLVALILMLVGIVAIYSTEIQPTAFWPNPQIGDILIIAATFLWAIENIIARKAMIRGESNFLVSFGRMFFGSLILFGILLLSSNSNLLVSTTQDQWIYILISTAILFGYVLTYYWSIKHINVSKASTILLIAPVITMILGVIFFEEPVPLIQLIGSFIILAGAYLIAGIKSEFTRI
ncbi:MAG: DMT family transporter, partial [Candidatus Aenigmatarchaeota archaeon]